MYFVFLVHDLEMTLCEYINVAKTNLLRVPRFPLPRTLVPIRRREFKTKNKKKTFSIFDYLHSIAAAINPRLCYRI